MRARAVRRYAGGGVQRAGARAGCRGVVEWRRRGAAAAGCGGECAFVAGGLGLQFMPVYPGLAGLAPGVAWEFGRIGMVAAEGWANPEQWGRWSVGRQAKRQIRLLFLSSFPWLCLLFHRIVCPLDSIGGFSRWDVVFQVECTLPWPYTVALPPRSLEKYGRVLTFTLKIDYASHVLERAHLSNRFS